MSLWRSALALLLAASPAGAVVCASIAVSPRLAPVAGFVPTAPGLTAAGLAPSAPGLSLNAPALAPSAPGLAGPAALLLAPPALPPSALTVPSEAPGLPERLLPGADAYPSARPQVFHSLQAFADYVREGRGGAAADRIYSGALPGADAPVVDPAGERPSFPVGVRAIEVHRVRTPSDVSRWIPVGSNSNHLIDGLRASVSRMAPFDIYVYRDAVGGSFAAVDLKSSPSNVDRHPELAPHETALIKKIQLWTSDLQVLVREEGKTPDLVVNGVVTEIKSAHPHGDLAVTFATANEQVWKHARRHGLGMGAVAVDLMHRGAVPDQYVMERLNSFAKTTRSVGFSRAYVFAGSDLKVYSLGEDGRFTPDAPPPSFGRKPRRAPARDHDVRRVRELTSAGRLEGARAQLARLEAHSEADERVSEARDELDAERVLRKIVKFVSHGRDAEAKAVWSRFRASHPAALVRAVEPRALEALRIAQSPRRHGRRDRR